jgi:hypothetical protein
MSFEVLLAGVIAASYIANKSTGERRIKSEENPATIVGQRSAEFHLFVVFRCWQAILRALVQKVMSRKED